MAQLDASSSIIRFSISKVSQLTKAWSPEVTLYGIPWSVRVDKYGHGATKSLVVSLFRSNRNHQTTSHLTAAAFAKIKLVSFISHVPSIERFVRPYVYDRSNVRGFGIELINWNTLFSPHCQFVQNDAIKLEVEITAENIFDAYRCTPVFRCIDKSCDSCCLGTYEMAVKNISKLMAVRSSEFVMRGNTYNLDVYRHHAYLGVQLCPNQRLNHSASHNVVMSIELTSTNGTTTQAQLTAAANAVNLISWNDLFDRAKRFVINDTIKLKLKANVNESNGTSVNSQGHTSDAVSRTGIAAQFECSICLGLLNAQNLTTTPCGHLFCTSCIIAAVSNRSVCPLCNKLVSTNDLRRLFPTL